MPKRWVFRVPFGVVVASLIVGGVTGDVLRAIFAGIALIIAIKMLFHRNGWTIPNQLPSNPITNGAGFGISHLSTFMGIGGGNLYNLFVTSVGQSIRQAAATSAGLGVLIAILGALGYVSLLGAALVVPLSILAAPYGAMFAHSLPPRKLEITFGVVLLVVIARMVLDIVW